jgi:hypothetical protein
MVAGLLHDLDAHDRVLVEERPRVVAVGSDTADACSQVNDDLGPLVLVHTLHVGLLGQVVLGAGERTDLRSRLFKQADHLPA